MKNEYKIVVYMQTKREKGAGDFKFVRRKYKDEKKAERIYKALLSVGGFSRNEIKL